ncbi:MAG: cation acetate symporter, partial [Candidatus Omnitrophica bacterium]|nr:cation acetate symporter [Candidatus Omnitrophota bacterium]
ALLLAPYLRKFGKYTVPDFVGDRYYSNAARVVAVVAAIFVSLTYVAGQMRGVGIVFSRFLQVEIEVGVFIGMVIVAFFAVLGGMKGITWTQVAQYMVLIVAFLIPAVAIALILTGNPIPQLAFTTSDILPRLNEISVDLGFTEYTKPFVDRPMLDVFCITLALMVGTAGLPHVIVRFYTVKDVRAARYSAGWALLFIALLYTTAPALAAFARYNLIDSLHGATVVSTGPSEDGTYTHYKLAAKNHEGKDLNLHWTDQWQKTKLLQFNDKNGNGQIEMSADKEASEVTTLDRDIIVLSTPEVANLSPWVIALVAAGGLAAALSTAAGLLLVISSSIAHDIYFRLINPHADEAHRVLVGRGMVILGLIVAGYFGAHPPGFVGEVVAFAFGLAAASFFPIILLGIFYQRANREGAIAGMIVGLSFTIFYIVGTTAQKIIPGVEAPFFGNWCFGISPQGIGTVGMLLNLIVCLVVSKLTPPPPQEVQDMVADLRIPAHPGAAYILDEGTE